MARSRCSCGAQILWKADEPSSDELLLIQKSALPDEVDHAALLGLSAEAARCSQCGHLWVSWDRRVPKLIEYAPVEGEAGA